MKRLLFLVFIFLKNGYCQPPLQVVRVISTRVGFIGYRETTKQHRGLPRRGGQIFINPHVTPQHETSKT